MCRKFIDFGLFLVVMAIVNEEAEHELAPPPQKKPPSENEKR